MIGVLVLLIFVVEPMTMHVLTSAGCVSGEAHHMGFKFSPKGYVCWYGAKWE